MDGEGVMTYANGASVYGRWKAGNFVGKFAKRKSKKEKEEEYRKKTEELNKDRERKKREAVIIAREKRIAKEKREQEILIKKERETFENAKAECEAIGYKKGTEKFGECVLDLTE